MKQVIEPPPKGAENKQSQRGQTAREQKLPEGYLPAEALRKDDTQFCLVVDFNWQIFKFKRREDVHIVTHAIKFMWPSFDQFDAAQNDVIAPMHQLLFKRPVPGDQDRLLVVINLWLRMLETATDRTVTTDKHGEKVSPGLETRELFLTPKALILDGQGKPLMEDSVGADGKPVLKEVEINGKKEQQPAKRLRLNLDTVKTPQAKTCLRIMADVVHPNDKGDLVCTEGELKKAITERQAELKTRQEPWRIFQYYRPRLVEQGLVRAP